jgi:hypothetical protein
MRPSLATGSGQAGAENLCNLKFGGLRFTCFYFRNCTYVDLPLVFFTMFFFFLQTMLKKCEDEYVSELPSCYLLEISKHCHLHTWHASRANLSATKNTFDLDVTHWLAMQAAPRPVSIGKLHVKSEASINGLL